MPTQLELARNGDLSPAMEAVAAAEGLAPEGVRDGIARGAIALPRNPNHSNRKAVGIGAGLRTKANASRGTSSDIVDVPMERSAALFGGDARGDERSVPRQGERP
jgi:phosphomethylpyrimidine synthase